MLMYVWIIFCTFMMVRNFYTSERMREGSYLVFEYLINLDISQFDKKKDYYKDM